MDLGAKKEVEEGEKLEEAEEVVTVEVLIVSTTDEEQLLCSALLLLLFLLGTPVYELLISSVAFGSSSTSSLKSFRRRQLKAEAESESEAVCAGRRGGKNAPRVERSILLSLLLPTC